MRALRSRDRGWRRGHGHGGRRRVVEGWRSMGWWSVKMGGRGRGGGTDHFGV
jgi:hypothetical protein